MRQAKCCLLVLLLGSWIATFAQSTKVQASAKGDNATRVVARFKLLDQTGPVSPIVVFTPTAWGMYRISTVMVLTKEGGNGDWYGNYSWTDGGGIEQLGPIDLQAKPGFPRYTSWIFTARMKAGAPLMFAVTPFDSPAGKYNVWIVVERM